MQCVNYCEIVKLFRFSWSQSWCFGIRVSVSEALTFGKLRSSRVSSAKLDFWLTQCCNDDDPLCESLQNYCSYKKANFFHSLHSFLCVHLGVHLFLANTKNSTFHASFGWKLESSPAIKRNEYMRKSCCILYNTGGH